MQVPPLMALPVGQSNALRNPVIALLNLARMDRARSPTVALVPAPKSFAETFPPSPPPTNCDLVILFPSHKIGHSTLLLLLLPSWKHCGARAAGNGFGFLGWRVMVMNAEVLDAVPECARRSHHRMAGAARRNVAPNRRRKAYSVTPS